jgi:hypothetical protein
MANNLARYFLALIVSCIDYTAFICLILVRITLLNQNNALLINVCMLRALYLLVVHVYLIEEDLLVRLYCLGNLHAARKLSHVVQPYQT